MRSLAVIFALVTTAASAQSFDCPGSGGAQAALTQCASEAAAQADTELNRLWKLVKPQADARGEGQTLLDAQRTWLSYRDQTCELESDQYAGGSIAPMIYYACIQEVTLARNERLRALLLE